MNSQAGRPSFAGRRIRGIVFDIDGTLSDSVDVYLALFDEAAATVGLKADRQRVLHRTAYQLNIWEELFPYDLLRREELIEAVNAPASRMYAKAMHDVQPFPNADKALKAFTDNHIRIGAVTASSRESMRPLSKHGLDQYFQVMISGWDDGYPDKPAPDSIIACLNKLKVKPDEAIVVGDTPVDIIAGKRSGALTAAVLSGVASRDILERDILEKEEPEAIVDWVGDIPSLLGILGDLLSTRDLLRSIILESKER